MKKLTILIIGLISIYSCNLKKEKKEFDKINIANHNPELLENITSKEFECPKFDFVTNKTQADSIVRYFETAKELTNERRIEFEKLFFCSFPNSFSEMENIFGFDSKTGKAAPLYNYSGMPDGTKKGFMSYPIISYFANLKSIPSNIYYNKFINICVNGTWQADNIRKGFDIYRRLENDTKAICNVLSKRNQKEIYSVFKFIFDGPHPDNELNNEIFNSIYPLIKKENIELSNIFKRAYTDLINKGKHGH